jgi:hypothetical protein
MAQRTNSTNWSNAENVTGARMQDFNDDLDVLFEIGCSENVSITWDTINNRITSFVDNENSITYTVDWSMFNNATTPYFEVTDDTAATNTWRFSYSAVTTYFTGVALQP